MQRRGVQNSQGKPTGAGQPVKQSKKLVPVSSAKPFRSRQKVEQERCSGAAKKANKIFAKQLRQVEQLAEQENRQNTPPNIPPPAVLLEERTDIEKPKDTVEQFSEATKAKFAEFLVQNQEEEQQQQEQRVRSSAVLTGAINDILSLAQESVDTQEYLRQILGMCKNVVISVTIDKESPVQIAYRLRGMGPIGIYMAEQMFISLEQAGGRKDAQKPAAVQADIQEYKDIHQEEDRKKAEQKLAAVKAKADKELGTIKCELQGQIDAEKETNIRQRAAFSEQQSALGSEISKLQAANVSLHAELSAKQAAAQEQLQKMTASVEKAYQELIAVQAELKAAKRGFGDETEVLAKAKVAAERKTGELQSAKQTLEENVAQAEGRLQSVVTEHAAAKQKLEFEIGELQKQLAAEKEKNLAQAASLSAQQTRVAALVEEKTVLQTDKTSLTTQISKRDSRIADLMAEQMVAKREVEALHASNTQLSAAVETSQQQIQRLNTANADLQTQLEEAGKIYKVEATKWQSDRSGIESRLTTLTQEIAQLQEQNQTAGGIIAEQKQREERLQGENAGLEKKFGEVNSLSARLQKEIDGKQTSLEAQAQTMQGRLQSLEAKISGSLREEQKKVAALQQSNAVLQTNNDFLREQFSTFTTIQQQAETVQAEINRLQQANGTLQKGNTELSSEIAQLQEKKGVLESALSAQQSSPQEEKKPKQSVSKSPASWSWFGWLAFLFFCHKKVETSSPQKVSQEPASNLAHKLTFFESGERDGGQIHLKCRQSFGCF